LEGGIKIPIIIFRFARGDLKRQETIVLHYYIVDGKYYEEVFPLQVKLWRLNGMADYIARVMITAPINTSNAETAEKLISSFAVDSANSIIELFESIRKEPVAEPNNTLETGDSLR
jgi:hypothetical protein